MTLISGDPPSILCWVRALPWFRDPTVPVVRIAFLRGGEPMESLVYLDAIQ